MGRPSQRGATAALPGVSSRRRQTVTADRRAAIILCGRRRPTRLVLVPDKNWIDRYVPDDLRRALGDLVILAADVEWIAYAMARIYRLVEPERLPAKSAIGKLEARIGTLGVPPWSDGERRSLISWCHDARSLLQQRNVMIHASMSLRAGEDGELVPHRWSLRDNAAIDSEVEDVQRLVTALTRLRHFGVLLEHSLCYPSAGGERVSPEYVTFGRTTVPPIDVPDKWKEWAERAAVAEQSER
jgi:hypothetical protein